MKETLISLYFVMMAFKYDYSRRYLVTPGISSETTFARRVISSSHFGYSFPCFGYSGYQLSVQFRSEKITKR
jgi:hypothetical protein